VKADQSQTPLPDELLTCQEVARFWRVDLDTVYLWIKKGVLGVVRVGAGKRRLLRITRAEVNRHTRQTPGAHT